MKSSLRWLPLGAALGLLACGDGDSSGDGTGGAAGTGGAGGAGTNGAGSGGSAAAGSSGAAGTGGTAGKAGGAGSSGGAGASGTGGKSGAAGGPGGAAGASGAGPAGASGVSGGSGQSGAAGSGAGAAGAAGGSAGGAGTAGAAGMSAGGGAGSSGAGGSPGPCDACQTGFVCKHDTCVPDLGPCATNDDCPGDSYCDDDKTCVPYGVPPTKTNDPTCQKAQVPTKVTPVVQCEWTGPAAGDPTAKLTETYSTPVVVDLNLDGDPNKIQPSIILSTFDFSQYDRLGMLRVFDGRTCQEQMRIGGPDDPNAADNRPGYVGGWAVGDLDGDVGTKDGHPEIVGFHRIGLVNGSDPLAVVAFGIDSSDPAKPKLVRRWLGRDCKTGEPVKILSNAANLALGLHDLDNDGVPEVIVDRLVFDAKGCVLNPSEASKVTSYDGLGIINTVADADLDGVPDLIHFDGVYGWDTATKDWVLKPWATKSAALTEGNVAIADVGAFSEIPGHPKTDHLPEIIVTASGKVRVQTLKGDIVFGPFDVHNGGRGGPPTAADFDGDGQVEFATAGAIAYTVYDPDCVAGADPTLRPGGTCAAKAGLPSGVLWTQPSQDKSSNCTGSSVFDFNGDGQAEVIYRDECFVRVYEGKTGEVIYSSPASSGTGYEYPVIVDVDGDFATEIVVPRTTSGATSCTGSTSADGTDKLFPGSGPFQVSTGFTVLRDPEDRWVSSRPIWNQHAFSITNVNDDGSLPNSSSVLRNWEQKGLNNFRQNTQGSLSPLALADLTVELQDADKLCAGTAGSFNVSAKVCNRGTNPVQDGASVVFTQQVKGQAATAFCSSVTGTLLAPNDCTIVTCSGTLGDDSDVLVSVDPKGTIADCHPGNNQGASSRVLCGKP